MTNTVSGGAKLALIKKRHDKSYQATEDTRERGANDLIFARLTQWDDTQSEVFTQYRGEFNILRPARTRLISGMRENDIVVRYSPDDGADLDSADVLNGMYRASMRENVSKDAVNVAIGDQIDAGYGAWRLTTEYSSKSNDLDNKQVIKRVPIQEANNTVYWDPDCRLMDKSDAKYCTILTPYTQDGFEALLEDLGIDKAEVTGSSFAQPEESYVYPWSYGNSTEYIHVGEYYEVREKKESGHIYMLSNGDTVFYTKKQIEEMDEPPENTGSVKLGDKTRTRREVFKYLVTGGNILVGGEDGVRVPGEHIPVIPVYGQHFFLENVEIWEGITRLAKDPCRLRNMMFSYLADIMAKGPIKKPFFTKAQVAGLQQMYEHQNIYRQPYYLLNDKDAEGNQLPLGPVNYMEAPDVPPALAALVNMTTDKRQSIDIQPD